MDKRITCWHWLAEDKRLRWGTKEKVRVGRTYTAEGSLVMCKNGMHGSRRLLDALQYAPGTVLCRVQIWGGVQEQSDKLVGRNRKVLAMVDATKMLHEAACHFAEEALTVAKVTDVRCWNAIEIKRAWIKGNATDAELAAAGDAAWAAARDAAGDAARDAARKKQNKYLEAEAAKLLRKEAKA